MVSNVRRERSRNRIDKLLSMFISLAFLTGSEWAFVPLDKNPHGGLVE